MEYPVIRSFCFTAGKLADTNHSGFRTMPLPKLSFRIIVEEKSVQHRCKSCPLEFGVLFGFFSSFFGRFLGVVFGAREGMSCKLSTVYEDTFDLPIEQGYSDESECVLL